MLSRRELLEVLLAGGATSWVVEEVFDRPSVAPAAATDTRRMINVKTHGAVGDGSRGDGRAIQKAIAVQQRQGGVIFFPEGTYLLSDVNSLVPAPWPHKAIRPLIMKGDGIDKTVIQVGRRNGGIFNVGIAGKNPSLAPLELSHMTFDGNYAGVAQGIFPQGRSQLFSLAPPYHAASQGGDCGGIFHRFDHVRFYRPQGFVFQPARCAWIQHAVFDSCGQPDRALRQTHFDNIGGGGDVHVKVMDTEWRNSAGNYADLVQKIPHHPSSLIMMGCESRNHMTGGIYAAGTRSILAFNTLRNHHLSGVGYDTGTVVENRQNNVVLGNVFSNLSLYRAGLSGIYGDMIAQNVADDAPLDPTPSQNIAKPNVPYRNAFPSTVVIYQSVYALSSRRPGRIEVFLGKNSFPSLLYSQFVDSRTTSANPFSVVLTVPAGFYYAFKTYDAQLSSRITAGT